MSGFVDATAILTAVSALGAVLGLIFVAQAVARRHGRFSPTGTSARLALIQSVALDGRRRVQLLRCDGQHFLILTGGATDIVLDFANRDDKT